MNAGHPNSVEVLLGMNMQGFVRFSCLLALVTLASFSNAFSTSEIVSIPNARSAFAPAIAVIDDVVFVAWRGGGSPKSSDDDQQLYLASYRAGKWGKPIELPGKSMFGPALAVHEATLFVAWHGAGNLFTGTGDGRIFFGSFERGQFTSLGAINQAASAGPPGLAVYNGLVYAAWRGLGNITLGYGVAGNEHWILYSTYDLRTKKWSSAENSLVAIVHANSTAGPGLATANDRLYALWRGTGSLTFHGPNSNPGDPLIYHASFDGSSWSAQNLPLPTIPDARTAWGASATEWDGRLCVGWRGDQPWDGAKGDQLLHFALLAKNNSCEPLDLFKGSKQTSAFGPSLASARNRLWVAWRGPYDSAKGIDDQALYLAIFNASASPAEPTRK